MRGLKLKEDFRPNAPISQVPASWFNGVARRLNGIVGGFGIDFTMGTGNASPISLDFKTLLDNHVFAPGFAEIPNIANSAFVALTSGSTLTNSTKITGNAANGHTAGFSCKFVTRSYQSGSTIKLFIRKLTFSVDGRVVAVENESQTVDLTDLITEHEHGNITNDGKIIASGNFKRILGNSANGTIVTTSIETDVLAKIVGAFSVDVDDDEVVLPFGHIGGAGTGLLFLEDGTVALKSIGTTSGTVAAGDHTHDYSEIFAPIAHTHNGVYQPAGTVPGHTHDISQLTDTGDVIAGMVADVVADALEQGGSLNGVLFDSDIGTAVQEHSDALDALEATLDPSGKVPISQVDGSGISGHSGTCLVTVDNAGSMSHSGNKAFNLLDAAANSGGQPRSNNKIITDIDISDGLEADSTTHNLKVKCKSEGGVELDLVTKDLKLGSLGGGNADKFLKTDSSGNIGVATAATDLPVTRAENLDWSQMITANSDSSGYNVEIWFHAPVFDANGQLTGFATPGVKLTTVSGAV